MSSIQLLVEEVKGIKDERKARGKRYNLHNLLAIIILSIISGADDYVAISEYCKSKKSFLLRHQLIDGIRFPSHDLIRLILQNLDKESFAKLLANWLSRSVEQTDIRQYESPVDKKMIHIDGKSLRASRNGNQHSRSALQIITAYCSNTSISIGQSIIDKKSCEKVAIPQLIKLLDLKHCLITIDAIAGYKAVAKLIIEKEADYLLALKRNNKLLFQSVEHVFNCAEYQSVIKDCFSEENLAHGRIEYRQCEIITDLSVFPKIQDWKGVKSVIRVLAHRTVNGKTSVEERFYISSLDDSAKALAKAIRKHWTVENELHWSMDVSFNEDRCTIKHKQAAANFAAIRRFALALLKNAKLSNVGIKNQRLKAAWSDEFLEKVFRFFMPAIQ